MPIYIQTKAPKKGAKQPIHTKQGLDSETLQNRGLIKALNGSEAELIRIQVEELFFLSSSPAIRAGAEWRSNLPANPYTG